MSIDLGKLKSNLNEYDRYQAAWYMWPDNLSASPEDLLALIEVAEAAREYHAITNERDIDVPEWLTRAQPASQRLASALKPFKETS